MRGKYYNNSMKQFDIITIFPKIFDSDFNELIIKTNLFKKQLSQDYKEAMRLRLAGDYGHHFLIKKEDAENTLKGALSFVKQSSKYINQQIKQ